MIPIYPDNCIQSLIKPSSWWEKTKTKVLERGRLIWAFLPHVDQIPYELIPTGRVSPTNHTTCVVKIEAIDIKKPAPTKTLPLAALPQYPGERYIVQRAKRRPALVVSAQPPAVEEDVRRGFPRSQTNPHVLVAPYYGAVGSNKRGGFAKKLIQRVRLCFYPQFMWDRLPISNEESILRFDHIQPVGVHHQSIEITEYRLGEDALDIVDEWIEWLKSGKLDENAIIYEARGELLRTIRLDTPA